MQDFRKGGGGSINNKGDVGHQHKSKGHGSFDYC